MPLTPEDLRKRHLFYGEVLLSVVIGFLIIATGVVVEAFQCSDWLARSGAVLVLFELILAGRRLAMNTDEEVMEWLKLDLLIKLVPAHNVAAVLGNDAPEMSREDLLARTRAIYDEKLYRQKILNTVQIGLLVVGTFFWAFGDLLLNFDKCPLV